MNLRTLSLSIATAALGFGAAAVASETRVPEEASIPFANHGGIRNWRADRDEGLWVQDSRGKWYYAKVFGACPGLNFAMSLGFDTHLIGSFDRHSAIVVPREGRCTIESLAPSDGPPGKDRKQQAPAAGER